VIAYTCSVLANLSSDVLHVCVCVGEKVEFLKWMCVYLCVRVWFCNMPVA